MQRSGEQVEEKRRIGAAAADLVRDGETIFLGSGTTAMEVAACLHNRRDLTVFTNSLAVVNALGHAPGVTVTLLGGTVRMSEGSLIGPLTMQALAALRSVRVIMGIRAIDLEEGLTNNYLEESLVDREILRIASETILVADHSKCGRVSIVFVARARRGRSGDHRRQDARFLYRRAARARDCRKGGVTMLLADYQPRPALVTKTTLIDKPRFPVIDAHNHLGEPFGGGWEHRPIAELLDRLDAASVRHYVDLDGGWGEEILRRHLDLFQGQGAGALSRLWRRRLGAVAAAGSQLWRVGGAAAGAAGGLGRAGAEDLEAFRPARHRRRGAPRRAGRRPAGSHLGDGRRPALARADPRRRPRGLLRSAGQPQ